MKYKLGDVLNVTDSTHRLYSLLLPKKYLMTYYASHNSRILFKLTNITLKYYILYTKIFREN